MVGVFIVFSSEIAVGRKGTRRLRATLIFQPGNSTRTLRAMGSGVSVPIPGVSGLGRETSIFALLLIAIYFEQFTLLELEFILVI